MRLLDVVCVGEKKEGWQEAEVEGVPLVGCLW